MVEARPHISEDIDEKVQKFKERHMGTSKYEVYEKIIDHFIKENGGWKSSTPDDLKEKFGQELAV